MLRFTAATALLAGVASQLPQCQVDSSPTCNSGTSICGYVPVAYGMSNSAVCAPIAPVNATCTPGVEVVQQVYYPPMVSAILNAWVCDNNNNKVPIGGLSQSSFAVLEDGAPASVEASYYVVPGDLPKLRTLILVDVSYSMTGTFPGSYFNTVNNTIIQLYNLLQPRATLNPPVMRSHWLSIGIFAGGAQQRVCDYFNLQDYNALTMLTTCLGRIDILIADDSSNVYDTMVQAVSSINQASQQDPEYTAASPLYFNTVLLISDGVDSANIATMNAAIASNTQVAAIGTGAYLNSTAFAMLLPSPFAVPNFIPGAGSGTVNPLAASVNAAQGIFEAKTLARAQYQHSGHYFIRYCTASRGNARADANNMHTLTVALIDPANPTRALAGSAMANLQFQAQPSTGPCRDRVTFINPSVIPGKMSTMYGGLRQFACAFVGQNGVVDKFFCPTPAPSFNPSSPTPTPSSTVSASSTYRPMTVLTVGVQPNLDGHSVGAGIGITLAIFFAIMGSVLIYVGVRYYRNAPHEPVSLPKSGVVVSQNPLSYEPRSSVNAFAPSSVTAQ